MVAAVLDIITSQIPEVVGINLSKNRLTSLMPFKPIKTQLKELKALDLSYNSVRVSLGSGGEGRKRSYITFIG